MSWIPPRLRPVLGPGIESITADSLAGLIGHTESQDLEFKLVPWTISDSGRKECAYDIADKANGGGALIVVGVSEQDGVATSIEPFDQSERDLGLWIHQIVAERISPPVRVAHQVVESGTGEVHLVSIEPSTGTPHGVAVGSDALRFPVRAGTTRRWLAEGELADWYQRRASRTIERDRRIEQMAGEALTSIPSKDNAWAWLAVAGVPEYPGRLDLRPGLVEEWGEWATAAAGRFPNQRTHGLVLNTELAFRSLNLFDALLDDGGIYSTGGTLNLDGSGYLIFGQPPQRSTDSIAAVFDEHLISDIIAGVSILSDHALRAGSTGNLDITAEISRDRTATAIEVRQYRTSFPGSLYGSRSIDGPTGRSHQTGRLDMLAVPGLDVIDVARRIATDLLSAFGLYGPQQVTAGNELVKDRWDRSVQDAIETWARQAGVGVVEGSA